MRTSVELKKYINAFLVLAILFGILFRPPLGRKTEIRLHIYASRKLLRIHDCELLSTKHTSNQADRLSQEFPDAETLPQRLHTPE
jgi:hypothetical protein